MSWALHTTRNQVSLASWRLSWSASWEGGHRTFRGLWGASQHMTELTYPASRGNVLILHCKGGFVQCPGSTV